MKKSLLIIVAIIGVIGVAFHFSKEKVSHEIITEDGITRLDSSYKIFAEGRKSGGIGISTKIREEGTIHGFLYGGLTYPATMEHIELMKQYHEEFLKEWSIESKQTFTQAQLEKKS